MKWGDVNPELKEARRQLDIAKRGLRQIQEDGDWTACHIARNVLLDMERTVDTPTK